MSKTRREREGAQRQKDKFLELFPKLRYHKGKTAKAVGVHRNTVLYWLKNDEEFKANYNSLLEERIDDNEERLFLLAQGIPKINKKGVLVGWIEKPNVRALEIQMKALAKHRGYGGAEIVVRESKEDDYSNKTDEELLAEIERIKERYND